MAGAAARLGEAASCLLPEGEARRAGVLALGGTLLLVLACWAAAAFWRARKRSQRMGDLPFGALVYAAARGDLRGVVALSSCPRFDVNQSTSGFTALHAASVKGNGHVVRWLLAHGASVSAVKADGWRDTPLHYAAANGHGAACRQLLSAGAVMGALNFAGKTPADMARENGFHELASTIESATAPQQLELEVERARPLGGTPEALALSLARRGWEGLGSPDVSLKQSMTMVRVLLATCELAGLVYMVWRALETMSRDHLGLSVAFYLCELSIYLPSFVFVLELWSPIERKPKDLATMGVARRDYPTVDVLIPCVNEEIDIIEATVCAALNIEYPKSKLTVYLCDDGRRPDTLAMITRLWRQERSLRVGPRGGPGRLRYVVRPKVKGTDHHAKAGNLNHTILKGGSTGDLIVVFDCDMIAKPGFLRHSLGHFLTRRPGGSAGSGWALKPKAGFIQIPQDFYNVPPDDPLGHRARFFYGPMMQGRDGAGAAPCVGTGVIFRRDALLAIGGQAYGSITEDYNTSMKLMAAGFASMYLNHRLIYGLAPDDIQGVLKQRLRWAMGSLQILCRDNPLLVEGLTWRQRVLFLQSGLQYGLAFPVAFMAWLPVVFMFTSTPPLQASVPQFLAFFFSYYWLNRASLWAAHQGVDALELWRGSQMFVWTCPNNIMAVAKTLGDTRLFRWMGWGRIGFAVTSKSCEGTGLGPALSATWPFLLYYLAAACGVAYNAWRAAVGALGADEIAAQLVALVWTALVGLYIWPPVETLCVCLRQGPVGRVVWFEDAPAPGAIDAPPSLAPPSPAGRRYGGVHTPREEAVDAVLRHTYAAHPAPPNPAASAAPSRPGVDDDDSGGSPPSGPITPLRVEVLETVRLIQTEVDGGGGMAPRSPRSPPDSSRAGSSLREGEGVSATDAAARAASSAGSADTSTPSPDRLLRGGRGRFRWLRALWGGGGDPAGSVGSDAGGEDPTPGHEIAVVVTEPPAVPRPQPPAVSVPLLQLAALPCAPRAPPAPRAHRAPARDPAATSSSPAPALRDAPPPGGGRAAALSGAARDGPRGAPAPTEPGTAVAPTRAPGASLGIASFVPRLSLEGVWQHTPMGFPFQGAAPARQPSSRDAPRPPRPRAPARPPSRASRHPRGPPQKKGPPRAVRGPNHRTAPAFELPADHPGISRHMYLLVNGAMFAAFVLGGGAYQLLLAE